MTSSEFLYSMNLKKIGVVHGRWSMGWSMEGVQGVVHGGGPRGGPWTGGQWVSVFNSPLQGVYSRSGRIGPLLVKLAWFTEVQSPSPG